MQSMFRIASNKVENLCAAGHSRYPQEGENMSRGRIIAAVATIALVLAQGATPPLAAGSDDIADALRFRHEFGFETNLAYVTRVESDGSLSDADWGVRLTSEEAAEMSRRLELEAKLGPLFLWADKHRSMFGGAYVDQAAGFVIDLAFTKESASDLEELESLVPEGAKVRTRTVDRTLEDLENLAEAVAGDTELAATLGVAVTFVAPRVRDNVVEIGVHPLTPNVSNAFSEKYGDGIAMFDNPLAALTACTGRQTCNPPPERAGTAMKKQGINYSATASFAAYRILPGPIIDYIQLACGHCYVVGQVITHNNDAVTIGTVSAENWYQGTRADAGWVTLNDSWTWPNVYITPTSYTEIWSVQGNEADFEGQSVCISGITIGNSCGTILNTNATVMLGNPATTLYHQRTASYVVDTVVFGDSGGPVRSGSTAVGIQSGVISNPQRSTFSHIWEVENALGIHVSHH